MTTYLVSCPDCGSRIEVDRQTMRAVPAPVWPRYWYERFIKNDEPETAA